MVILALGLGLQVAAVTPSTVIRVNQLGYLPDAPKVAVLCALQPIEIRTFVVARADSTVALERPAALAKPFGPCVTAYRLDFSAVTAEGEYRIPLPASRRHPFESDGMRTPARPTRCSTTCASSARDAIRSSRPSSTRTTASSSTIPPRAGKFVPVTGGWADASDYLQYVTTSANATYVMLMAYRDHPRAFADDFDARGLPGANGVADVLDEARHGLDWLLRMFPDDDEMYNQLGDDRDHSYFDLPPTDSSDYGWGQGKERPVYPCTGRPQGLFTSKNRSTGYASTAGKYASAFALAAHVVSQRAIRRSRRSSAREPSRRTRSGSAGPACARPRRPRRRTSTRKTTGSTTWSSAAAELFALTARAALSARRAGVRRAGAGDAVDGRRHRAPLPVVSVAQQRTLRDLAQRRDGRAPEQSREYYRRGLDAVVARADNGFRIGVPFIWCSNNLMASFATQAYLYRRMTGDNRFREYEQAAIDWLFGANPWGVSMVIGLPHDGSVRARPALRRRQAR